MTEQQPITQPEPQAQSEPQQPQAQLQPEPQTQSEPANPYQSIIEQQQEQINALLQQTKTLNEQIVSMVNGGAQLNQQQPQPQVQQVQQVQPLNQQFNPVSLASDEDWTLEGLAKEIGKKDA